MKVETSTNYVITGKYEIPLLTAVAWNDSENVGGIGITIKNIPNLNNMDMVGLRERSEALATLISHIDADLQQ